MMVCVARPKLFVEKVRNEAELMMGKTEEVHARCYRMHAEQPIIKNCTCTVLRIGLWYVVCGKTNTRESALPTA